MDESDEEIERVFDQNSSRPDENEVLYESNEETADHQQVPSLRGAPAHMRSTIRRMQNVEYARRSRERRREEFRELMEQHNEQIMQINQLEERVAALIQILLVNSIEFPDHAAETVQETLRDDVRELPSNQRLFYEFARVLDDNESRSVGPSAADDGSAQNEEE